VGVGQRDSGELAAAVRRALPSVRADLERLVRIGSVSADPAAAPRLRASAAEVAAMLRAAGLPEVDVLGVEGGQPAVLGRRPGPPGAPTVLLYAHHDVQPPGDATAWDSDPFEPSERDGRLYGRGAADDKAGVAVHLAALRAHGDRLPVGVTVLVEGEEEIGSPALAGFLAAYSGRIRADVLVLADSINWAVDVPALTTSLRGGANVTVEVRALRHVVHSGAYGGPVPEHGGLAATGADHLDLGQPGGAQQRRHLPGAGCQVRRCRRIRRHRRDPDQSLQVGAHRRQHACDRHREPLLSRVPCGAGYLPKGHNQRRYPAPAR